MGAEVVDARTSLASEGMMICVAHELGFARKLADRLIFMDQDEIVEQGGGCGPRQSDQPADKTFLPRVPGHWQRARGGHGVALPLSPLEPTLSRRRRIGRWPPGPADPL